MVPTTRTHDLLLLDKALNSLTRKAEFPLAFGGLVTAEGAPLTSFVGTRGQTLSGLLIEPTQGLGGRALSERRPVAATQYRNSPAITHRYDREVLAEDIVSLLAIPVIVDGSVRAVLYGAHRTATQFGDSSIQSAARVAKGLAFEYSVHDEVERRIAQIESQRGGALSVEKTPEELELLRSLYAEIRELGASIADQRLAARLSEFGRLLGYRSPAESSSAENVTLSPRELDVIAHVALGKKNAVIGSQLGLTESTVKSYLSSAMRKLGVTGRFQAVVEARRHGLVP